MLDTLITLFTFGFSSLQESFYFFGLLYLFCKFAKWIYKIFMRKRLMK